MARRLLIAGLLLLVLLALLLGAATAWRLSLAQALLDRELAARGVPGGRATVQAIDGDRLRLVDIAAGDDGEFALAALEVRYRPLDLVDGRVAGIEADGLTLRLDLREGEALFGSLQPFVENLGKAEKSGAGESAGSGGGRDKASPAIPDIQLSDGRIEALTPFGAAAVDFAGRLDQEDTEGGTRALDLDLDVEMTSDFGRLSGRLSAAGDPQTQAEVRLAISGGAVALPDGQLRVDAVEGDLALTLDAGLPRAGRGDLTLSGLSLAGTPFQDAGLRFELSREAGDLTARLASGDGSLDVTLGAKLSDLAGEPQGDFDLTAVVTEAAPIWSLGASVLPDAFPSAGAGRIAAKANGRWPRLPDPQGDRATLLAWLKQGELTGQATADLGGLSLPGYDATLAAVADLTAAWSEQKLSLAPQGPTRFAATGATESDLGALGLDDDLAKELARLTGGALTLSLPPSLPPTLPGEMERPGAIVWRPGDPSPGVAFDGALDLAAGPLNATLDGQVEASLGPEPALTRVALPKITLAAADIAVAGWTVAALDVAGGFEGLPDAFRSDARVRARLAKPRAGEVSAERLDLDLPLEVTRAGTRLDIGLAGPGKATLAGLRLPGGIAATAPVEVAIANTKAEITLADDAGAPGLSHDTRLALGESTFLLRAGDGAPLPVRLRAPRVDLAGALKSGAYAGTIAVRDAALALPDQELALDGLTVTLDLPADRARMAGRFSVAALKHLATPAAFAPLAITGEARRAGRQLELNAEVGGPGGRPLAELAGRHDLETGRGTAEVTLIPLRFAAGGLQPKELSPRLAAVSDARGAAEAEAALSWDGDGLAGSAQVLLAGLGFTAEDTGVKGLDLRLDLDSLDPVGSLPGQRLSAKKIDVGVDLEDVEARFRLPRDAPGQVFVEDAAFSLAGSRIAVRDTLFDPLAEHTEADLLVDRLDLATLFDVLAIEGLSGSGELSGSIPVERDGKHVTVKDAHLESSAPGMLRFSSATAEQALKGGGEYVELLMQALKDFRYETLLLTGSLDRDGEALLRLEILGHNPDVLDGRKFQLNVNLTGNMRPILDALRQGHEISSDFFRRAWKLSP